MLPHSPQLSSSDVVYAANAHLSEPECEGEGWRKYFYRALDVLNPEKADCFQDGVKLAQAQLKYLLSELQSALHADKADQKRVRNEAEQARSGIGLGKRLFLPRTRADAPLSHSRNGGFTS
jgi:hypothetical protein